jgi:catalase-peroxidase
MRNSSRPTASSGHETWRATRADLIFGSNAEAARGVRGLCRKGGQEKFAKDFVKAWTKVMNADRFDVGRGIHA